MTDTPQDIPIETFAQPDCDVFIAGGGYVGLCLALALARSAPDLAIMVVDAAPESAIEKEGRASAIAAAASRMLLALGVWDKLAEDAQPIREMIVTDSALHEVVRPVFLTFGDARAEPGDARNEPGGRATEEAPFAHMVANRALITELRKACRAAGVDLRHGVGVADFAREPAAVAVQLADGETRRARLLVAADGVRSRLRELAGIGTVHWPYDQKGIVVTVAHERDHEGRAEEHFLPAGPFAILPLKGRRSSLVWTERTDDADRLLAADRSLFELELEQRFGHHLGALTVEGEPRAYPLGLTLARSFIGDRFALAGDAAHGIHPIAGQGLNLGFKDVAALAEVIVDAHRLGQDIGAHDVLERYQQWRRFDTVQMGVVTDVLNRLFSNDNALLRGLRDFGLGLVDRMPGLKQAFIAQAAGNQAGEPRLLRGETV